jgi:hypothetical protein
VTAGGQIRDNLPAAGKTPKTENPNLAREIHGEAGTFG